MRIVKKKDENIIAEQLFNKLKEHLICEGLYQYYLLNESGNRGTFPYSDEIISNIENYIKEYIKNNHPNKDNFYEIILPDNVIDNKFWDKQNIKINIFHIEDENMVKQNGWFKNGYMWQTPTKQNFDYVKKNGKLEKLNLVVSGFIDENGYIDGDLYSSIYHELLHAYEDFSRMLKGNSSLSKYCDSTNYDDWWRKRDFLSTNDGLRQIHNKMCILFHFFNKTEQRAMISEFNNEFRNGYDFNNINFEKVIKDSKIWNEICEYGDFINSLNKIDDSVIKDNLLELYNKHVVKGKVSNYEEMLHHINRYFINISQDMFIKMSKIVKDKYSEIASHTSDWV